MAALVRALPDGAALLDESGTIAAANESFAELCDRPSTDLLGLAFFEEFGALDGLFLADPYHDYTVDAHSLNAVAMLEGFAAEREREDRARADQAPSG